MLQTASLRALFVVALGCAFPALALPPTPIEVPTDQPTIADAIANIDPGGIITVLPGTYNENLSTGGKNFTLRGADPLNPATVAATLIAPTTGDALTVDLGSSLTLFGLTVNAAAGTALIVTDSSSAQVARCNLTGDAGTETNGGGARINAGSTVEFAYTNIVNSRAQQGAGIWSKGVVTITDSVIANNTAESASGLADAAGGGILVRGADSSATITRTAITGNTVILTPPGTVFNEGGGISAIFSPAIVVKNSLIADNVSGRSAAINCSDSNLAVINCTVANNVATDASDLGAVDVWGVSTLAMANTIVYGNTDPAADDKDDLSLGGLVISSNLQYNNLGSVPASGTNISADPKFIDPPAGNYRIRAGSPSIDAGSKPAIATETLDLLNNPRLHDDPGTPDTGVGLAPLPDHGAYEFQSTTVPCPADVNDDGFLDNGDISAFIAAFLGGDLIADFNGDTFLDNGDISAFIAAFLAGC